MIGETIEDNVHKRMIPFLQILAHIAMLDIVEKGLIAASTLQQLNSHLEKVAGKAKNTIKGRLIIIIIMYK